MLQEADLGFKSAMVIVKQILPHILRDPWDSADIDDLFQYISFLHMLKGTRLMSPFVRFIIATHSPEQNQLREYPSKILTSPLSLDVLRSPSRAQKKTSQPDQNKVIRNLIFELLLGAVILLQSRGFIFMSSLLILRLFGQGHEGRLRLSALLTLHAPGDVLTDPDRGRVDAHPCPQALCTSTFRVDFLPPRRV